MLRLRKNNGKGSNLRLGFTTSLVRRLFQELLGRPAYGGAIRGQVMDDEDILSDRPNSAHPWEPWHCSVCDKLIYNTDSEGKPTEGAPCPRYISQEFPVVCSLCWGLYVVVDKSEYMSKLSKEDKHSEAERAKRIKRLRPGEEYLG